MIDCDFLPDSFHQTQSSRRAIKLRGTLISALIAIMVIWVTANQHQLSSANAMLTEVTSQREQIAQHLNKRDLMEEEKKHLRDRQRLLEQFESRASLVVVLCDLSRRLPETVVLTKVAYRAESLHRFALDVPAESPQKKPPVVIGSPPAKVQTPAVPDAPPGATEIRMSAFASEVPEAIKCAAALERSPLVARVQMELKGETTWGGRRGQEVELTCVLLEQTGIHP